MLKTITSKAAITSRRLSKKPWIVLFLLLLLFGSKLDAAFAQQFKKLRPQAYQLPANQIVPPQAKFYAVKSHPSNSLTLYSATAKGLQASDNGGLSWRPIAINGADEEIFAIAIHPTKPESLLACRRDGLWKTTDGGASWSLSATPASVPLSVAISANQPEIVYLGTAREGVYKSTDGGHLWTQAGSGLPDARAGGRPEEIRSLVVDPGNSKVAYAAFAQLGIYRTVNGGLSWHEFNRGLSISVPLLPPKLVFDPNVPERVYLAFNERYHSHRIMPKVFYLSNEEEWLPIETKLAEGLMVMDVLIDGARNVLHLWGSDGVWEVPLPSTARKRR